MQRTPCAGYRSEFKLETVRQAVLGETPTALVARAHGFRGGHLCDWRPPCSAATASVNPADQGVWVIAPPRARFACRVSVLPLR